MPILIIYILFQTELPYLNERLITTDIHSQASKGQDNSFKGQDNSFGGQKKASEAASTVSSFVKRTTEGIVDPLLESSTDSNHSESASNGSTSIGSTSIGSTSTGSTFTSSNSNGSITTDSTTNINDTLVDTTPSNSDKQGQDSSSDNHKEVGEETVDSDKFSEITDATSDSSTIKESNNNNLDNDLLTSRIPIVDVDDEMSLQGGKSPSKNGEANDNDEDSTLMIDHVASDER